MEAEGGDLPPHLPPGRLSHRIQKAPSCRCTGLTIPSQISHLTRLHKGRLMKAFEMYLVMKR